MEVVGRTLKEIEWITGLSPTHYKNICRGNSNSNLEHMKVPLWQPFSGRSKKSLDGSKNYQVAFPDLIVFTIIQGLWFSKRSLIRAVVDFLKIISKRNDGPLSTNFKGSETHIIELGFYKRDTDSVVKSLATFRYSINGRLVTYRLISLSRTSYVIVQDEFKLGTTKTITSMRFNLNELHELVKSKL